jgi:tRNA pseudouridine38-40 synthase
MRRIRITLAYDGTNYHGWQVQPGLETIQATVQRVVSEIEGETVHVTASGRTDAGVHALAQVAAFDLRNPLPPPNLRKAMNRLLPRDIRTPATTRSRKRTNTGSGAARSCRRSIACTRTTIPIRST